MSQVVHILAAYVFWYPLLMSLIWIAGSIIFSRRRESKSPPISEINEWPMVSILIPCFNEADTIEETIRHMVELPYPNKEIIAVNDGSVDGTGAILDRLSRVHAELRIIDCKVNRGKAAALNLACHASQAEYLVCVDSDAVLDAYAIHHLIYHFLHAGERLGAVTGNPRIRNRDTLLAKLQIVEYASIIGAIKRAQRLSGKIMTVSGVVVAFRKKALVDVGLWDMDMITEDISISWKLQEKFWDVRYEPKALCWMLAPETFKGIWKQRIRWAQGGQEVILRHWKILPDIRHRRLWPIYIEQWMSLFWAYSWVFVTGYLLFHADEIRQILIWLTFSSFVLVMLSMIQLLFSLFVDNKYDRVLKYFFFGAWYPSLYWLLNAVVVMFAFPKAIASRIKGGDAVWQSPDRGFRK